MRRNYSLKRLVAGFAQPDASVNPAYGELAIAHDLIINLLNVVDKPQIEINSITLEYARAEKIGVGYFYIPVYDVQGYETTMHLPFETYVDSTTAGAEFTDYLQPKFHLWYSFG